MALRPNSFLFRYLEFYGTRIHHRGHWWIHSYLRVELPAETGLLN
jgi:hypothetical protein